MIVTRSRLHAVRYKLAVDANLAERGYSFKALVPFSGTVEDDGRDCTEPGMNGLPETQTAKTFDAADQRFLIVANKLQTGFDQPLLHTMYVDKKLGCVSAVQTLSWLNRTQCLDRGYRPCRRAQRAGGHESRRRHCSQPSAIRRHRCSFCECPQHLTVAMQ